jgi:hypothetical protein
MDIGKLRDIPEKIREDGELSKDFIYLCICFLLVAGVAAVSNLQTPDEPVEVGYTEVHTDCVGVEAADFCIGVEKRDHTTYNYDNYTEPEPGTENFYRRVESELMLQAYKICDTEMKEMEWTDKAEYKNKTATEWLENDEVELLPCEKTFYRKINATT